MKEEDQSIARRNYLNGVKDGMKELRNLIIAVEALGGMNEESNSDLKAELKTMSKIILKEVKKQIKKIEE